MSATPWASEGPSVTSSDRDSPNPHTRDTPQALWGPHPSVDLCGPGNPRSIHSSHLLLLGASSHNFYSIQILSEFSSSFFLKKVKCNLELGRWGKRIMGKKQQLSKKTKPKPSIIIKNTLSPAHPTPSHPFPSLLTVKTKSYQGRCSGHVAYTLKTTRLTATYLSAS